MTGFSVAEWNEIRKFTKFSEIIKTTGRMHLKPWFMAQIIPIYPENGVFLHCEPKISEILTMKQKIIFAQFWP